VRFFVFEKDFIMKLYTTEIRQILKAHGLRADRMFTNKYKKCRTVKIYGPFVKGSYKVIDEVLKNTLRNAINEYAKSEGFTATYRTINYPSNGYTCDSFIIRVPLQD